MKDRLPFAHGQRTVHHFDHPAGRGKACLDGVCLGRRQRRGGQQLLQELVRAIYAHRQQHASFALLDLPTGAAHSAAEPPEVVQDAAQKPRIGGGDDAFLFVALGRALCTSRLCGAERVKHDHRLEGRLVAAELNELQEVIEQTRKGSAVERGGLPAFMLTITPSRSKVTTEIRLDENRT